MEDTGMVNSYLKLRRKMKNQTRRIPLNLKSNRLTRRALSGLFNWRNTHTTNTRKWNSSQ